MVGGEGLYEGGKSWWGVRACMGGGRSNYTVKLSSSLYAHDAEGRQGSLMTQSMDAAMLGGRWGLC